MTAPDPNGLTHDQVNHVLGDRGLPRAQAATIRSWVRRGLLTRALDGGIDRRSVDAFVARRLKQIADEIVRRQRAAAAPDRER